MIRKNYYQEIITKFEDPTLEIKKRELINGQNKIAFLYIEQLTDKVMLSTDIIKPISQYLLQGCLSELTSQHIMNSIIYGYNCIIDEDTDKIHSYILEGMTIILLSNDTKYIIVNSKHVSKRNITTPELTFTLRGPRDSFNENLDTNLSLVRHRIKDPNLSINILEIGRRSRTRISILHIKDIANEEIVNDVTNRIKKIDVDGIVDSGEIQKLILNGPFNLFPQTGIVERSDMAAAGLLEGKVLIIVDGSPLALIAPKLFSEFFMSCEDNYDNKFLSLFVKYVRIYSTFLSITVTALYIAIISFHIDTLPADFVLIVTDEGQGAPFSVFVGALILEFLLELLREALLRVPKQIGPAIGIVGGIVIGQAAIAANIFSPLLLIVVSISLLSTFISPDYTIMNPLRIMKFFFMVMAATFGLIGLMIAISIMLINIISSNSFGVPYLAPFAPYNWPDLKNTFFYGKEISPLRPNFLNTKNRTRFKK